MLVIVGADRIAANGDTANKIGTLGLSVLAKYFKMPFYVAAPISTIDMETPEWRCSYPSSSEMKRSKDRSIWEKTIIPEYMPVKNPAFDVTQVIILLP